MNQSVSQYYFINGITFFFKYTNVLFIAETVMGVNKQNEGRSCFDYAQAVMK